MFIIIDMTESISDNTSGRYISTGAHTPEIIPNDHIAWLDVLWNHDWENATDPDKDTLLRGDVERMVEQWDELPTRAKAAITLAHELWYDHQLDDGFIGNIRGLKFQEK